MQQNRLQIKTLLQSSDKHRLHRYNLISQEIVLPLIVPQKFLIPLNRVTLSRPSDVNLYSVDIDINKNLWLVVLCIAISIKLLKNIWLLLHCFQ